MIEKFEAYLGTLPITKTVKDRVDEIINLNLKIQEFDIKDIFICELKNSEGSRSYTSLWLFTDKYFIECKDFLTTFDFDITPYLGKIQYCSISPKDFDLETATEKSIVNIHFSLAADSISGSLISTEQNCLNALSIYRKYIVSNLI